MTLQMNKVQAAKTTQ